MYDRGRVEERTKSGRTFAPGDRGRDSECQQLTPISTFELRTRIWPIHNCARSEWSLTGLHVRMGKSGCVISRRKREHVVLTGDGHTNVGAHFVLHYHVSLKGLISTLNDHAERGWPATCQASSAIAAGAMKKSSGLVLKRSRAHGTSITASMTM